MAITVTSSDGTQQVFTNDGKEQPQEASEQQSVPNDEGESASEESETSEDDSEEVEQSDDEESDGEDSESDEEDEEKPDQKPKKRSGFKKRIDRLNKKLSAKEQEAEYWRQQALNKGSDDQPKQQESQRKEAASDDRPQEEQFDTHTEYVEALSRWAVRQEKKEVEVKDREAQALAEHKKTVQAHNERVAAFKKQAQDYDKVVKGALTELGEEFRFSIAVEQLVLESENGPELIYELMKKPEELERICELSPMDAAREIGRLEARLAKSSERPKPEVKKTSAPPPISPVGNKGTKVVRSIYDPNIPFEEYERLRRQEMKSKR